MRPVHCNDIHKYISPGWRNFTLPWWRPTEHELLKLLIVPNLKNNRVHNTTITITPQRSDSMEACFFHGIKNKLIKGNCNFFLAVLFCEFIYHNADFFLAILRKKVRIVSYKLKIARSKLDKSHDYVLFIFFLSFLLKGFFKWFILFQVNFNRISSTEVLGSAF